MKRIGKIVGVVVVLIMVWILVSPLFIDKRVDDELSDYDFAQPGSTEMPKSMDEVDGFISSGVLNTMDVSEKMLVENKVVEFMADNPVSVSDEMADDIEVRFLAEFQDADNFHKGEGVVTLFNDNGEKKLEFRDFRVTNGPDLRVILSKHSNPQKSSDLGDDYIEIAKLKGNIGNQSYVLPAHVNIEDYGSVVIYCKPFHVLFSVAVIEK